MITGIYIREKQLELKQFELKKSPFYRGEEPSFQCNSCNTNYLGGGMGPFSDTEKGVFIMKMTNHTDDCKNVGSPYEEIMDTICTCKEGKVYKSDLVFIKSVNHKLEDCTQFDILRLRKILDQEIDAIHKKSCVLF